MKKNKYEKHYYYINGSAYMIENISNNDIKNEITKLEHAEGKIFFNRWITIFINILNRRRKDKINKIMNG